MGALTTPSRILRTALQHMQRHGWHTAAAISVMTLTFFITSLFIMVALGANQVLHYFEKQPQMIIFFKDEVTDLRCQYLQIGIFKLSSWQYFFLSLFVF